MKFVALCKAMPCGSYAAACGIWAGQSIAWPVVQPDWYGSSDRSLLDGLAPGSDVVVLTLCPLSREDIRLILRRNHAIEQPETIIEHANEHGLAFWLENPQNLKLLTLAITEDDWPDSRSRMYGRACEILAQEHNQAHRNRLRERRLTSDTPDLIHAAGQLCAVLLLAGRQGIATDPDAANREFPDLEAFATPDRIQAEQALHCGFFIPTPESEERLQPSHRSLAEYLAARWLGRELDRGKLSLERVLGLLLGADGGVISDLRGLYAWLALHSCRARPRLIAADPLSVVLYGDTKSLGVEDKRELLDALRTQAAYFPGFRWQLASDMRAFGDLADDGLVTNFADALAGSGRDDATQAYIACVLDILIFGTAPLPLAGALLKIARDTSYQSSIRARALEAWLRQCTPKEATHLLAQIGQGRLPDDDDELTGILLEWLYPAHLSAGELLQYMHQPKNEQWLGSYALFWHDLHARIPSGDISLLLDRASNDPFIFRDARGTIDFSSFAEKLLIAGLDACGDKISNEQLFDWLAICADEYGELDRSQSAAQYIRTWIGERPERYKAILRLHVLSASEKNNYRHCPRLHGAPPPDDLGLWHLQQAEHSELPAARIHLALAADALIEQQGSQGVALEMLEAWRSPPRNMGTYLDELLSCSIDESRRKDSGRRLERKKKQLAEKHQRTLEVTPHLDAIRSGTAPPGIFYQLAGVWLNRYAGIGGQTNAERFAQYSEQGSELMRAAAHGFMQCPLQKGLPTARDIIGLYIQGQRYLIGESCLLGMELRWEDGPANVEALHGDIVDSMLAFHFTFPMNGQPAWFAWLLRERPTQVAKVLIQYARACLQAGRRQVTGIHQLAEDKDYAAVARIAAPELLRTFPLRAKKDQLDLLAKLLRAALRDNLTTLSSLVDSKLSRSSLDNAQRVYWHATAMLLDPPRHEAALWKHIGKSSRHAYLLAQFLSFGSCGQTPDYPLSAHTQSRLIELIAPHAEMAKMSGTVTEAMLYGDQVRDLIHMLAVHTDPAATGELDRLLELDSLHKLKPELEHARHQRQISQREQTFRFQDTRQVACVLASREPVHVADLAAMATELLGEIAYYIRHANDDGFRSFWNLDDKNHRIPRSPRAENICRDTLSMLLRPRLEAYGIGIVPEADHHNDKRADLCLTYCNAFSLPIEIKRDSNPELWTGLRKQLIGQYADAPKSSGYGIYLVLWFQDGSRKVALPNDGGKRPQTPAELRARLEAQLTPEERTRIVVRVLDVSWPA